MFHRTTYTHHDGVVNSDHRLNDDPDHPSKNKISTFANAIASNVVKFIKLGKPVIYITCSAFKSKNEDVVNYLVKELGLKLEEQTVLTGYEK